VYAYRHIRNSRIGDCGQSYGSDWSCLGAFKEPYPSIVRTVPPVARKHVGGGAGILGFGTASTFHITGRSPVRVCRVPSRRVSPPKIVTRSLGGVPGIHTIQYITHFSPYTHTHTKRYDSVVSCVSACIYIRIQLGVFVCLCVCVCL
jgi:hypothetical protein